MPSAVGPAGGSGHQPGGRFCALQRVRKRVEFREVQANGRRVLTSHFVLLVYARSGGSHGGVTRLGITASRKVGSAVVRNRMKRLIREAFRATRQLWEEDIDVVVIVRRAETRIGLSVVIGEWEQAGRAIRRRVAEAKKDRERRESRLAQGA